MVLGLLKVIFEICETNGFDYFCKKLVLKIICDIFRMETGVDSRGFPRASSLRPGRDPGPYGLHVLFGSGKGGRSRSPHHPLATLTNPRF